MDCEDEKRQQYDSVAHIITAVGISPAGREFEPGGCVSATECGVLCTMPKKTAVFSVLIAS